MEFFRWFNHISAAAEAYKQRTKSNHDMTPIEDPASVTIPSTTTKETTDHEFVTSATNTSVLNTSGSNATAENAQNQSQDGQKDTARLNVSNDAEAVDRESSFFFYFFSIIF